MTPVFALALLAAGGGALVLIWSLLRDRHRELWKRIRALEADVGHLRAQLVDARKNFALLRTPSLRLAPAMPSQHGEDLILWQFFDGSRIGFFVEAGAFDGYQLSNTYFLEAAGWTGLLVEPNPDRFADCRRKRPYSRCVHAALVGPAEGPSVTLRIPRGGDGYFEPLAYSTRTEEHELRFARAGVRLDEVEVPAATLELLLEGAVPPIQLLSLDLEGGELEALRGLAFDRWRPEVVLVEDNSQGRFSDVRRHLSSVGYVEQLRLGSNVFYLRRDDARSLSV